MEKNKIGCSLQFGIFAGCMDEADSLLIERSGGLEALLSKLYSVGVRSVELRGRTEIRTPENLFFAAELCNKFGLSVTDHGAIKHDNTSPESFFEIYEKLFNADFQNNYNITVHPLPDAEQTADAIHKICMYVKKNKLPVTIALENNRSKIPASSGDSCAGVMNVLQIADCDEAGICFDFGHHFYNVTSYDFEPSLIPCREFLQKVCHTHIHALNSKGWTHIPLSDGNIPLDEFINALKSVGYDGVYNLELDPRRYYKTIDPYEALLKSVELLKQKFV